VSEIVRARVEERLTRLRLGSIATRLDAILSQAARKEPTYLDFLDEVLGDELDAKQKKRVAMGIQIAHFPTVKLLEEFDFKFQPSVDQRLVRELAGHDDLYLICGRYEGVDERVATHLVDREISIGDYVLTGGELPAMVLIDAVSRLVTGVLGSEESPKDESFDQHLLEYPHYTRPPEFEGHPVPEVLRSGHHAEIERWRRAQAAERTRRRRPDLLDHQG